MFTNPSASFASMVVFVASSVWGLYWVPLRIFAADGVEGGWAAALLNLPPLAILIPVVLWRLDEGRGQWGRALAIGLFAGTGLAFYASGLVYSSVVRVTLLFYLTPVWSTVIGMVWLGERPGWLRALVIALGLGGMALMLSGGGAASQPFNVGDMLGLLSGLSWGIAAAIIRRYPDVPLAPMTAFQFACTAGVALLCALVLGPRAVPDPALLLDHLPLAALLSIGFILPTVWAIFWAQKFLSPGRAGLLMMSEALVAVISASLFLPEERMALLEWTGAALIITACLTEVTVARPEDPDAQARRPDLV